MGVQSRDCTRFFSATEEVTCPVAMKRFSPW